MLVLLVACSATDAARNQVPANGASCGNGIPEGSEECDDGNAINTDGCLATCRRPANWISGDVHLHSSSCDGDVEPEELTQRLRMQGLQVGAVLVWGKGYDRDARWFTGRDHPVSQPNLILHYDMEISRFAAGRTGHLILLGLDSLRFSDDIFATPASGVPVTEWARDSPGAVIGMAHVGYWPADGSLPLYPGGCCMPWEVVVHAVRGRLDFLSTERVAAGEGAVDGSTFHLWSALQNSGFRVAIAGGSDWLCIHRSGPETPRTDVIVDGALTYENWLGGIKEGRTALVNAQGPGDHLNLRVEGRRLGDELRVAYPQDVTISLETAAQEPVDVDVLVNGEPVFRTTLPGGIQVADIRLPITKSSWVVARSQRVLTSPVYVLVAEQPIRASAADSCYLQRSVENLRDLAIRGWLRLEDTLPLSVAAYDEAIAELHRRFIESGGDVCGPAASAPGSEWSRAATPRGQ